MSAQSASFDDFECLAERMHELACDRSTITGTPLGVVLCGVIFHLAVEALLNDVPVDLLMATIGAAAGRYQSYEHDAEIAEAHQ